MFGFRVPFDAFSGRLPSFGGRPALIIANYGRKAEGKGPLFFKERRRRRAAAENACIKERANLGTQTDAAAVSELPSPPLSVSPFVGQTPRILRYVPSV